jgi:hypothetical protein
MGKLETREPVSRFQLQKNQKLGTTGDGRTTPYGLRGCPATPNRPLGVAEEWPATHIIL